MKKLIAAPLAAALALGLAGCGTGIPKPQGPLEAISCAEGERFLLIEVAISRPAVSGDSARDAAMPAGDMKVTVQAWAPESRFTQVRVGGFPLAWMSGSPETQDRTAPFRTTACWPADVPVAFAVSATHNALQSEDEFECTFEDGWSAVDWDDDHFVAWDHVTAGPADLMRDSPPLAVQCVDYYQPEGYRGPELHQFPDVR